MTYQEYVNSIHRTIAIKRFLKRFFLVAAIVSIIGGLGYTAGQRDARMKAEQIATDVQQCIQGGASTWYINDGELECLFD